MPRNIMKVTLQPCLKRWARADVGNIRPSDLKRPLMCNIVSDLRSAIR